MSNLGNIGKLSFDCYVWTYKYNFLHKRENEECDDDRYCFTSNKDCNQRMSENTKLSSIECRQYRGDICGYIF